ncbi:hypothetical protein nbrc107696_36440 [Gordonia spumicola]|uniref:Protein kinase domain-containing protein n=1 Tax=Gordonia spumicola TaxID=589161 RepID=A0A7I9VCV6_9ACTN|nr:protein kinase [Gordonia spumicola]GEE03198.1 hypothetical protein nbrc107696_36440 [Gordonia spumicola]
MPAQPGSLIAGYRVVSLLGSGGMGDVYVVENPQLQRREAMKVISVAGASNPDFQERFANEARTAASLDHPSIITVHSYGVSEPDATATSGLPWFTMSYLDGPDLASTRLTPTETIDAIAQVASALDYAHGRSVIHRDVKPANIVITRDGQGRLARAVMLDFGIAKLADSPQLTAMNSVVGTMAYTAPEIISGHPASPRSDQYSLACSVYDVLVGHAPFRADTATALMMAHVQQPPPPLGQERPDLAALGPVIARAMAKDPAARFPTCEAFAVELRRALTQTAAGTATSIAHTPFPTPVPSPVQPGPSSAPLHPAPLHPAPPFSQPGFVAAPKKNRRGLWIGLAAAVVVLLAVAGGTWALLAGSDDPGPDAPVGPQLATAFGTTCAVTDGQVACWGRNDTGQLGDGTTSPRSVPRTIDSLKNVRSIALGGFTSKDSGTPVTACAAADGKAYCWGYDGSAEVGDGAKTVTPRTSPFQVPGLDNVTQVTTNYGSTCAIADGSLYCWGFAKWGQLGIGTPTADSVATPTKVALDGVTSVKTSAGSTCAIANGDLYCWGSNTSGQLGNGSDTQVNTPAKVPGLSDVTAVDIGQSSYIASDKSIAYNRNTCAAASGKLYCWGQKVGGVAASKTPVQVNGVPDPAIIASNASTTCVATTDGDLYCWGYNKYGQAGTGNTEDVSLPVKVTAVSDVDQLTTSWSSTCVRAKSTVQCWGYAAKGQLGPAATGESSVTPVTVPL